MSGSVPIEIRQLQASRELEIRWSDGFVSPDDDLHGHIVIT